MMDTVRISLVTPTLNSERYFAECLSSVHDGQPAGVEVQHIVVDGGSTDRTVEMARARTHEVISDEDEGLYDAMNIGIRRADGDVVGIINSDDMLLPGTLARVAEWYRNRRSEWMVSGIRWTNPDGSRQADLPAPPTWMHLEMFASLGWNCIHHQGTYITRDFYREVGEYDLAFPIAADYDLLARAMEIQPFDRIDGLAATFRRHAGSTSMTSTEAVETEGERIARHYGPASLVRRRAYRTVLKTWLNGTNPGWYIAKRMGRA